MSHALIQAAALIENFAEELNDKNSICDCCGLIRYDDFSEFGAKTQLLAMTRKLREWPKRLANK